MKNNKGMYPFSSVSSRKKIMPWRRIRRYPNITILFGLIFIALSMVSCSPLVKNEQPIQTEFIPLKPGESIGQTYLAHYDGLTAIEIMMETEGMTGGKVILKLYNDPSDINNFDKAIIQSDKLHESNYYRLTFTPLARSDNKSYYFTLQVNGSGQIMIAKASGNLYLNGSAYLNNSPQDSQITFRLVYNPWLAALGLLRTALIWLGYLFVAAFLFIWPGWLILHWLLPSWKSKQFFEKFALSAGTSLAVYPIILLWTNLFGFQHGLTVAFILPFVGLIVLVIEIIRAKSWKRLPRFTSVQSKISVDIIKSNLPDLFLILIILLIFSNRLWIVRNLDFPMWGDSLSHTTMAQLILDHNGLFTSWQPYAPFSSMTMQFGFPTIAALFAYSLGISAQLATLIIGQILNGLAAITIFPLAYRLSRGNKWAGCAAVLVAGLLNPMPSFYVNWGRYAQLAGLTILPVAIWLLWEALENGLLQSRVYRHTWSRITLAALTLAGMTLTYYRLPYFYALFALILLFHQGFRKEKIKHIWGINISSLILIFILFGLLISPWIPQIIGGKLYYSLITGMTKGRLAEKIWEDYQLWKQIFTFVPKWLCIITIGGFLWSLIQKRWLISAIGLWIVGLASLVAAGLFHLPGINYQDSFTILLSLYIPVSLIVGWLFGDLFQRLPLKPTYLGSVVLLLLILWGAWYQRFIIQPNFFALVTRPDTRAIKWIKENTSEPSYFLIEGFGYKWDSVLGSDAGWWISLLTHQRTTVPAQYALLNEKPEQPDYAARIVKIVTQLSEYSLKSPEAIDLLCKEGITHVYIGQKQGFVGYSVVQLFSPEELIDNPAFSQLYHQDRVYIYRLNTGFCP